MLARAKGKQKSIQQESETCKKANLKMDTLGFIGNLVGIMEESETKIQKRSNKRLYDKTNIYTPNFICSSDIREKMDLLVHKYVEVGKDKGVEVNLTSCFEQKIQSRLNVILNVLLTRKRDLNLTELLKDNLVYSKKGKLLHELNRSNNLFSIEKFIVPRLHEHEHLSNKQKIISSREVFVVALFIDIKRFSVAPHVSNIFIELDTGKHIRILQEANLVEEVIAYMKHCFLEQLDHRVNHMSLEKLERESMEVTDSDMSNNPFIEKGGKSSKLNALMEDNMDSMDLQSEELELLKAPDSRWSEEDFHDNRQAYCDLDSDDNTRVNSSQDSDTNEFALTLTKNTNLQPEKSNSRDKNFLDDIYNMRHNEGHFNSPSPQPLAADSRYELPHTTFRTPSKASKVKHNQIQQEATSSSPLQLRSLPLYSPLNSPAKDEPTPKRSALASPSAINFEDDHPDLKYAYNNDSPKVPSYIRKDKKFRFIKVGKVQKFVNLFEGNTDNGHHSTNGSRKNKLTLGK